MVGAEGAAPREQRVVAQGSLAVVLAVALVAGLLGLSVPVGAEGSGGASAARPDHGKLVLPGDGMAQDSFSPSDGEAVLLRFPQKVTEGIVYQAGLPTAYARALDHAGIPWTSPSSPPCQVGLSASVTGATTSAENYRANPQVVGQASR